MPPLSIGHTHMHIHTPTYLLYIGTESKEQDIPSGGPQGSLLTVIFFDLQVNLAGAPRPIPSLIPLGQEGPDPDPQLAGPLPLCHLKEKTIKKKYVDDLSLLETINLKMSLIPSTPIIGPPNFHEQPDLTSLFYSTN